MRTGPLSKRKGGRRTPAGPAGLLACKGGVQESPETPSTARVARGASSLPIHPASLRRVTDRPCRPVCSFQSSCRWDVTGGCSGEHPPAPWRVE